MSHVVTSVGSVDSDELSGTEDSYKKAAVNSSSIIHSEHSSSSFEKISPPTEIQSDTRQQKSQLMNAKVSKILLRTQVVWAVMLHHWMCGYHRFEDTMFL
jgi:hypothetical protein